MLFLTVQAESKARNKKEEFNYKTCHRVHGLAALAAIVLPTIASATSPELAEGGNPAAVRTEITATGADTVFKGCFGEVVCATATLRGNANGTDAVEGTIETANFTGTASSHSNDPLWIEIVGSHGLQPRRWAAMASRGA